MTSDLAKAFEEAASHLLSLMKKEGESAVNCKHYAEAAQMCALASGLPVGGYRAPEYPTEAQAGAEERSPLP